MKFFIKIKLIFLLTFIFSCQNEKTVSNNISLSKSNTISSAIKEASPGVVGIYRNQEIIQRTWRGYRSIKPISSNGSGFIISKDGYIITNAHNIRDNFDDPSLVTKDIKINVVIPGGDFYKANIVGIDMITDIALLKIEGNNFDYCLLGNSDLVEVGEWVVALGNPKNLSSYTQYQPIASAGIVSAVNADFNIDIQSGKLLDNMIQTDAALNPGNSGGPLIDSNGEVIAINTFISNDSQNLGFAIPINFAKKIANELKLKGSIDRRFSFGIQGQSYVYNDFKDGNLVNRVGIRVNNVDYNDSAINEEIFRGDIIVAVEGYRVESYEQIQAVLIKLDLRAGDRIRLTVLRENEFTPISMTLGK